MAAHDPIRTVLLVEDDTWLRRAVRRRFVLEGLRVTDVPDGSAALALVDAQRCFDVGVLDIDLPDMSGVELAPLLLERAAVRRVVFYSATEDAATLASADRFGPVIAKRRGVDALVFALLPPKTPSTPR